MALTADPVREAALPGGATLTVRHVAPGDEEALGVLYAGLDDRSRNRRFFSKFRPRADFFARMTSIAERGGAGLVAVTADEAGGPDRIVGEAGYELLSNGNGELAMTVDAGWRGWLGPWLLDALVGVAAARGVPNIEADVLATNGPMIAVLRQRGIAMLPSDGWTTMRVVIGTEGRAPGWPPHRRGLRVLVEGTGGHWGPGDAARDAGMEVLACPGPTGRASPCPALTGSPCPLAAGADVIVVANPPDADDWTALRAAHPALHAGVPVCVQVPRAASQLGTGDRAPGLAGEATIPPGPAADVVVVVERLARGRGGPWAGTSALSRAEEQSRRAEQQVADDRGCDQGPLPPAAIGARDGGAHHGALDARSKRGPDARPTDPPPPPNGQLGSGQGLDDRRPLP